MEATEELLSNLQLNMINIHCNGFSEPPLTQHERVGEKANLVFPVPTELQAE